MKKRVKLRILFFLIFIAFPLAACSSVEETGTSVVEGPGETAYPAYPAEPYVMTLAPNSFEDGYPSGNIELGIDEYLSETIEVPEVKLDTGIVVGTLVSLETNEPYLAPGLYLGSYISPNEDVEDAPLLVGISPGVDPQATQALNGDFVFEAIEPGDYGLFLWTPMSITLVVDQKTNQEMNITVEPGEVLDLGTIYLP